MQLKPLTIDLNIYPTELHSILSNTKLFDSSCSPEAKVIFIDKDNGYFLKSAPKNTLKKEADMIRYFHSKDLAAEVLLYISNDNDWLLTTKVQGEDCISSKHLEQPERLVDILAERLYLLHKTDFSNCPVPNRTKDYLATAKSNYHTGHFDQSLFPDNWGYKSAEEAYQVLERDGHLLKSDILLHGDYCLPNIILNDWKFSGFIDVGCGGVGDKHIDLFWALWTLVFNLKTDKYRGRFLDVYGRQEVNEDIFRVVAAAEVFG